MSLNSQLTFDSAIFELLWNANHQIYWLRGYSSNSSIEPNKEFGYFQLVPPKSTFYFEFPCSILCPKSQGLESSFFYQLVPKRTRHPHQCIFIWLLPRFLDIFYQRWNQPNVWAAQHGKIWQHPSCSESPNQRRLSTLLVFIDGLFDFSLLFLFTLQPWFRIIFAHPLLLILLDP